MTNISTNRTKFNTTQAWDKFLTYLKEIQANKIDEARQNCYKDIERYRGRTLLVYATNFLNNPSSEDVKNFITLDDIDGFHDLIDSIKDTKKTKVDVLLHSPGGMPDATERVVNLLRDSFEEIDFLIPHSAYSAATMLALSGDNIILHPNAVLGPIDPQIGGIPARTIKSGFNKIYRRP